MLSQENLNQNENIKKINKNKIKNLKKKENKSKKILENGTEKEIFNANTGDVSVISDNNDDSWDTVESEDFNIELKGAKKDMFDKQFFILQNIISIIKSLCDLKTTNIYNGVNTFSIETKILNKSTSFIKQIEFSLLNLIPKYEKFKLEDKLKDKVESDKLKDKVSLDILKFYTFNLSRIFCRIYFVLSKNLIESFLEYKLNRLVENTKKYDGVVFSVDFYGNIEDQTYYFCKSSSHWEIFKKYIGYFQMRIKESINNLSFENSFIENKKLCIDFFKEIDNERLKIIPKKNLQFKFHPIYISEANVLIREVIYPKRPIIGTILKNTKIYLRKNLWKLKTRGNWYFNYCLKPKEGVKPVKILRNSDYFTEYQLELEEIGNIDPKIMKNHWSAPAYNPKFTPNDCRQFFFKDEGERKQFLKFLVQIDDQIEYANPRIALYIHIPCLIYVYTKDYEFFNTLYIHYLKEMEAIYFNSQFEEMRDGWLEVFKLLDD